MLRRREEKKCFKIIRIFPVLMKVNLQYFRETFPTIPLPSFQSWLQLYNIPQQQQHLPSYQTTVPEQ